MLVLATAGAGLLDGFEAGAGLGAAVFRGALEDGAAFAVAVGALLAGATAVGVGAAILLLEAGALLLGVLAAGAAMVDHCERTKNRWTSKSGAEVEAAAPWVTKKLTCITIRLIIHLDIIQRYFILYSGFHLITHGHSRHLQLNFPIRFLLTEDMNTLTRSKHQQMVESLSGDLGLSFCKGNDIGKQKFAFAVGLTFCVI